MANQNTADNSVLYKCNGHTKIYLGYTNDAHSRMAKLSLDLS
jgi:predicted GIY-YIG superfamily endonuclease